MGLVYPTATSLLRQIVGGSGSFSTSNTYLALSITKPSQYGEYNVTEPSEESYSRVQLVYNNQNLYFNNAPTADEDPETGAYTFTISNSKEIHFPECTDVNGWNSGNDIGYFAIFTSATGGTPIYVGELESAINVLNNTVPLVRVGNLSISVK